MASIRSGLRARRTTERHVGQPCVKGQHASLDWIFGSCSVFDGWCWDARQGLKQCWKLLPICASVSSDSSTVKRITCTYQNVPQMIVPQMIVHRGMVRDKGQASTAKKKEKIKGVRPNLLRRQCTTKWKSFWIMLALRAGEPNADAKSEAFTPQLLCLYRLIAELCSYPTVPSWSPINPW
jgi:hypothetical protein